MYPHALMSIQKINARAELQVQIDNTLPKNPALQEIQHEGYQSNPVS